MLRMVEIHAEGDTLRFEVCGLHKLWALKSQLAVSRSAIRDARRLTPEEARGFWKGWRLPGTHLPGVLIAGTFYRAGERHFWDVRQAERALAIRLEGESYDQLFVEVADPEAALQVLRGEGATVA